MLNKIFLQGMIYCSYCTMIYCTVPRKLKKLLICRYIKNYFLIVKNTHTQSLEDLQSRVYNIKISTNKLIVISNNKLNHNKNMDLLEKQEYVSFYTVSIVLCKPYFRKQNIINIQKAISIIKIPIF